jgi:hypothetical protein
VDAAPAAPLPVLPRPARAAGPARVIELVKTRLLVPRVGEVLAVLAFAAWLLELWYQGAPDVPIWDGWTWISHARAYEEGGLRGLWKEHPFVHTQHIYALPSFFALLVGPLVGYSFRVFALACVAVVFANGLAFRGVARRAGLGPVAGFAVLAAVASMRHYENFLSGFQLGLPACVLFGSLAVIVADQRRDRTGIVLAWTLVLLSTASSSAGVFAAIAVLLVRGVSRPRPRLWIASAIACVLLVVVVHFALFAVYGNSFVADLIGAVTWSSALGAFENTARVVGGGMIGNAAILPVGLALLAGALAIVVTRIRRLRRVDALVGLVLFSFFSCVAIAIAREPVAAPPSRHAIFAAPLVGVCAIELLSWLKNAPSVRALGYSAVFVGLTWCNLASRVDADGYGIALQAIAFDSSYAITMTAHGERLSAQDIARVNPGPTEEIRAHIRFVVDRKYCGGGGDPGMIERHDTLPVLVHGATNVHTEDGLLHFAGQGHVYSEYVAGDTFGRVIQLNVDAASLGSATVGIIFVRPDGSERTNIGEPIRSGREFSNVTVRGLAGPGERIQPYVYAAEADKEVVVRSFQVFLVESRALPSPP